MVVGLEASDDALVLWLDMSGKIGLKVLNLDALKIWWNNVAREIVLEKEDFSVFFVAFLDPTAGSSLDTGVQSSRPLHCFCNKTPADCLTSC